MAYVSLDAYDKAIRAMKNNDYKDIYILVENYIDFFKLTRQFIFNLYFWILFIVYGMHHNCDNRKTVNNPIQEV